MQGVILSVGTAQGIILGDDGARYTFTPLGWRNAEIRPEPGMRVDFEVRGPHAVGIYPLPGATPSPQSPATPPTAPVILPTQTLPTFPTASVGAPPARPLPTPPVTAGNAPDRPPAAPGELPSEPTAKRRFGKVWWHWALAGGRAFIVLGVIGAVMLGIFSGSDVGKEIARHTHEGQVYVIVEYGNDLAIFTDSGPPVTRNQLAEDILRSYAWGQVISDFDTDQLANVSRTARALDESVADARDLSNDVVDILDDLDSMEADIPFLGSISAMDVIRDSFSGMSEAEDLIRSLDSELNALGDNAGTLSRASGRIADLEPSSVSGNETDMLFGDAAAAALDLRSSVASIEENVSDTRDLVESLASALRSASDTPMIGDAMGDFARSVGRFAAELSALSSALGGFDAELAALGENMKKSRDAADKTLQDDMERWLENPPDTTWPPADNDD